jgi:Phosphate-induced protein 1 conserved region
MKRAFSLSLTATLLGMCLFAAAQLSNNSAHAQGGPSEGAGAPEIIRHGANPHEIGDALTAGGTGALSPISYHGGALIGTPTAYVIWYGNWAQSNGSDNAAGQQIVRDFLGAVGNTPYFNINTTYSVSGKTISGNVVRGTEATDAYSRGTRLRDADILTIVNSAINAGHLPYDANGVYFVLSSSDVSESSGFCSKYCGWHTAGTASAGHVRYAFVGNANRCLNACAAQTTGPNGNAGVDGMISVVAHELEEATTDPDPRSGWADSAGSENADKCAWTFGSSQFQVANGAWANQTMGTRNFLIQRNLDARDNKCYVALNGGQ